MYYPGFRYRQRSSAYFSYTEKSSSRTHLGSASTISLSRSSLSLSRSGVGRHELPSPIGRRRRKRPDFTRSVSAPVTPNPCTGPSINPFDIDSILQSVASRLSTSSDDQASQANPESFDQVLTPFSPSSLPDNSTSFLASPQLSPCRALPVVNIVVDSASERSLDLSASSRPESISDLPSERARSRLGAVVAAASALTADGPLDDQELARQRNAGPRRRSVTFHIEKVVPPAILETEPQSTPEKVSPKLQRPSTLTLGIGGSPAQLSRRSSGSRPRSGSVVSSSSRSSGASNIYGKPPQPYSGDMLKFRRSSATSEESSVTVTTRDSSLPGSDFPPCPSPVASPTSPMPMMGRSPYHRRKSIDNTFRWGTDLKPTTIECCAITCTLLPKALSLPARILRRVSQACTATPHADHALEAIPVSGEVKAANTALLPRQLLKGVTFRAETGSLVAILGPTGKLSQDYKTSNDKQGK